MSNAPQTAPPTDPLVGRTIAGKYAIESLIGGGSMGAVYRARQLALDLPVAVKVMRVDFAKDPTFAARFEREARAASRLDHPNLVRVLDYGEDGDGLLYLVMELLDGRQLFDVLYDDWPLSTGRIVEILSQVLAALARAHDLGVVHRDIKPENVMVMRGATDDGVPTDRVKVCDFGIAMLAAPERSGDRERKLTTGGLVIGTPEYMSPEQARGEPTDARSDLYSVGVILFQLLTGRLPFEAETPMGVALRHVTDSPPLPSMLVEGVDPALESICVRAMAKKREDRYQTARELRAALRGALGGPTATPSTSSTVPSPSSAVGAGRPSRPMPRRTQPFAPKAIGARPATTLPEGEPPSTSPVESGREAPLLPAPASARRAGRVAGLSLLGLVGVAAIALGVNGLLHRAPDGVVTTTSTTPPTTPTMQSAAVTPGGAPLAVSEATPTAPSATTVASAAPSAPASGAGPRLAAAEKTVVPHLPAPTASSDPRPAASAATAEPAPTASAEVVPPPPPAPSASSTAPVIATAPPPPPKPAPLVVDAARVAVGAVSATNGVPVSSVRKVIDAGALTRCYRAALLAAGAKSGGEARLHLATDDQGYVTSASLGGGAPAGARSCIESVARGWHIANVDTGAAAADINLSFVPE